MNADIDLGRDLEELRRKFELGDVVSAWLGMQRVAAHNKEHPETPYPMPAWLNDYLLHSAQKITRLADGIRPDDERPIREIIESGALGYLRKVKQADGAKALKDVRLRDERAAHIGTALGLAGAGWNGFQRHDQIRHDEMLLHSLDDPTLQDDPLMRDIVRKRLYATVARPEGMLETTMSEAAFSNRASKARGARRKRPA